MFCFVWPAVVWSFQRPKMASIKPVSSRLSPSPPIKSSDNRLISKERNRLTSNDHTDVDVGMDHRHNDTMIMVGSCLTLSFLLFMPILAQAVDITVPSATLSSIDVPLPIAVVDFQAILAKATSRAVDGGTAGASAAAIQGNTCNIYSHNLNHSNNITH